MIKIYGVPNCNKIKKTIELLETEKISYTFINVKKEPISKEALSAIRKHIPMDQLINRKGTTYRQLGLKDKELSNSEMEKIVLQNQSIIKRPLIEKDSGFMCGFDEAEIKNFIKH